MVYNLTISSPEDSPNTDGIHLQNSKDVNIHHTNLACGNGFSKNLIQVVNQFIQPLLVDHSKSNFNAHFTTLCP